MNYLLKEETITDIADAIREKTATTDEYSPLEMPDAIRSIQGGGVDASIVDNPDGGVDVTIGEETRTLATQSDLSTLDTSVVKTVNGIAPDENGNVDVSGGEPTTTFVFEDITSNLFNIDDVEVNIQSTQYSTYYGMYLFATDSKFWWCDSSNVVITFSDKVNLKNISWMINTATSDRRTEIKGYVSADGDVYAPLAPIQLGNSYDIESHIKAIRFEGISQWSGYNNLKLTVETLPASKATKEYVDAQNALQDAEIDVVKHSLTELGSSVVKSVNNQKPDADGNVDISSGVTYTAGTNIQISDDNVISATDTKYTAGTNITIDENNVISATGGGGTGDVTKEYLEDHYYDKVFFEGISTVKVVEDTPTVNIMTESDMDKYATIEYVDSLMGRVDKWLGSGVIK